MQMSMLKIIISFKTKMNGTFSAVCDWISSSFLFYPLKSLSMCPKKVWILWIRSISKIIETEQTQKQIFRKTYIQTSPNVIVVTPQKKSL